MPETCCAYAHYNDRSGEKHKEVIIAEIYGNPDAKPAIRFHLEFRLELVFIQGLLSLDQECKRLNPRALG